ncbi:MAG: potassium channel family protein [Faecousia sp.]
MKTYVVIGMGRFGYSVACRLSQLGNEVLVIEKCQEKVQQIANSVTHAVVGDAEDPQVLRALGIRNYDCAIVAIGGDLSASVLTTLNLKELGVPMVVCKAHDENHKKVLEKIGADRVIVPERESAYKLAQGLSTANVLEYIELSRDYGITEFEIPGSWEGKSLMQLNVRAKCGVNILAVRRDGEIQVSPNADYVFEKADVVVVLGNYKALSAVQKK